MKYYLICLPLALSLSACNVPAPNTSSISGAVGTLAGAVLKHLPAQITADTKNICQYVPTVSTITNIIATLANVGDIAATATDIADSICKAVLPASSGPGLENVRQGYAYGVKIHGHFIGD